jgi:hypothetical protein
VSEPNTAAEYPPLGETVMLKGLVYDPVESPQVPLLPQETVTV